MYMLPVCIPYGANNVIDIGIGAILCQVIYLTLNWPIMQFRCNFLFYLKTLKSHATELNTQKVLLFFY